MAGVKSKSLGLQTLVRLCHSKLAVSGFAILFVIVMLCALAPVLTPYSPSDMDLSVAKQGPSWEHPCGTDRMGRDIFARLLYGGRYSIALGLAGALFSSIIGVVLGVFAGYFGKWTDHTIMRGMDVLQSIPGILIAILIATVLGGGFVNTVIALTVGGIPVAVRITRGQILAERTKEYLEAAESINCSKLRIMFTEVLPNTLSPLIVHTTMAIGGTIMVAASLSYIGLGVQPPTPEWGAMLTEGKDYLRNFPHIALFPGLAIVITVLAVNIFGDGLRDALDPKMKK
jgi:ABC-type dipeptide/oligopeptide/nickel transport system permease subunit